MKTIVGVAVAFVAGYAVAQCIVPNPPSAPQALQITYNLPPDGGTTGCTGSAVGTGPAPSLTRAIGPAMCAAAVQSANRLHALDNNWGDGGAP